MLSNPVYIGEVRHGDQAYRGEHDAIIDRDIFEAVQAQLAAGAPRPRGSSVNRDTHLLNGLLFDETGDRLSPIHDANHGRRYRYYISSRLKHLRSKDGDGWRLPSSEIDAIVIAQLKALLADQTLLSSWIEGFDLTHRMEAGLAKAKGQPGDPQHLRHILRLVFRRIELRPDSIHLLLDRSAIVKWLTEDDTMLDDREHTTVAGHRRTRGKASPDREPVDPSGLHVIKLPWAVRRRGVERKLVIETAVGSARAPDPALVGMLARTHVCLNALTLEEGCDRKQVANRFRVHPEDVSRLLPLAFLSPRIIDAILNGRQPVDLTVQHLTRAIELPIDWHEQHRLLAV